MLETLMVNDYQFESLTEINDNLQYLDYINANYEFNNVNVLPDIAYKFQGNFFGLLRHLGNIPPSLFTFTMYINGMTNPYEYDGEKMLTIKVAIRPPIPMN